MCYNIVYISLTFDRADTTEQILIQQLKLQEALPVQQPFLRHLGKGPNPTLRAQKRHRGGHLLGMGRFRQRSRPNGSRRDQRCAHGVDSVERQILFGSGWCTEIA